MCDAFLSFGPWRRSSRHISSTFTAAGPPDPGFGGGDGVAEVPGMERIGDIAVDPVGRVVAVGVRYRG